MPHERHGCFYIKRCKMVYSFSFAASETENSKLTHYLRPTYGGQSLHLARVSSLRASGFPHPRPAARLTAPPRRRDHGGAMLFFHASPNSVAGSASRREALPSRKDDIYPNKATCEYRLQLLFTAELSSLKRQNQPIVSDICSHGNSPKKRSTGLQGQIK